MTDRQILAIDMDEVVADCVPRFFEWYERDTGIVLSHDDIKGREAWQAVYPEHLDMASNYVFQKGFFRDLPVIEDSQEVIRELQKKYDIFFASAAMPFKYSLEEKHDWLEEHFPFVPHANWVLCGAKYIINADYLIDDRAKNFKGFRGTGLLFDAPHNQAETAYPRLRNWAEVRDYFLG